MKYTNDKVCTFCEKDVSQIKKLVSGKYGAFICDECVKMCLTLIGEENIKNNLGDSAKEMLINYTPRKIKAALDNFVIGQERAKKALAVAVRHHLIRGIHSELSSVKSKKEEIVKSNVLLVGPTGSGKTYLVQTLARILNIPLLIVDATKFTEAGYVGEDVEQMIYDLLAMCGYKIGKAEKGIIYIDEIDKICGRHISSGRDVGGEGVMQALLKLIEGKVVKIPPNKSGNPHKIDKDTKDEINTKNILFICGGSFTGLERIIQRRQGEKTLGFNSGLITKESLASAALENLEPIDLIKFGIIPELIGRLPVISVLHELSVDDLLSILIDPVNSLLRQYQSLFADDGVEFIFDNDALRLVAEIAHRDGSGARGLRRIMDQTLNYVMYEVFSDEDIYKCQITRETVERRGEENNFEFVREEKPAIVKY